MKRRFTAVLLAVLLIAFPAFALDTAAIHTNLGAIKILVDETAALLSDAPAPTSIPQPKPINGIVEIRDTPLINTSKAGCRSIRADLWETLIVMSQTAGRIEILDAGASNGDCPGHPGASHSDHGRSVDLRYIRSDARIWDENGHLLPSFDTRKNLDAYLVFASKYYVVTPITSKPMLVIMDIRVKNALMGEAAKSYGYGSPQHNLTAQIQGDDPGNMGHDEHAHMEITM